MHSGGNDGALQQIAAVLGEDDAARRLAHLMPSPTDALKAAGHTCGRLDLDHEIHGAHVDTEFQRTGGHDCRQPAGLERLFDLDSLFAGQRTVMGPDQLLSGQLVELVGQPLGQAARIAEDDRGMVLADEPQNLGVDRRPDAAASFWAPGRAAGQFFGRQQLAELAHVLDWDAYRQLKRFA